MMSANSVKKTKKKKKKDKKNHKKRAKKNELIQMVGSAQEAEEPTSMGVRPPQDAQGAAKARKFQGVGVVRSSLLFWVLFLSCCSPTSALDCNACNDALIKPSLLGHGSCHLVAGYENATWEVAEFETVAVTGDWDHWWLKLNEVDLSTLGPAWLLAVGAAVIVTAHLGDFRRPQRLREKRARKRRQHQKRMKLRKAVQAKKSRGRVIGSCRFVGRRRTKAPSLKAR